MSSGVLDQGSIHGELSGKVDVLIDDENPEIFKGSSQELVGVRKFHKSEATNTNVHPCVAGLLLAFRGNEIKGTQVQ